MTTSPAPSTAPGTEQRQPPTPLPNAGNIVQTAGINQWSKDHVGRIAFVMQSLRRHLVGDDGDLTPDDKTLNEHARATGTGFVLSAYEIPVGSDLRDPGDDRIWIHTILSGADTYTTVLFPQEY